jgi:transglycosylase-like protein with SLT domain
LPMLYRVLPIVTVYSLVAPAPALALDAPGNWIQSVGTGVAATADTFDPHEYLYAQAPDLAARLDCIIAGESGWDPSQQNPRTRAAGLAQFLPSTWATTPQGAEGLSPFDPLANIDAAIWLARTKGWQQWQVYVQGRCR